MAMRKFHDFVHYSSYVHRSNFYLFDKTLSFDGNNWLRTLRLVGGGIGKDDGTIDNSLREVMMWISLLHH